MTESILIAIIGMTGLGLLLGVLIGFAVRCFRVASDPRVDLVTELLPNANCGGCGKAGCADFARAVVAGELPPGRCPVSSAETVASIARALGIDAGSTEKKVAVVLCGGDCNQTKNASLYNGVSDCISASLIAGGPKGCDYGCLGMSSCARACPFGAIEVVNGLAVVHSELCVGCGKCASVCPRHLIQLVPAGTSVHIYCSSQAKGVDKRKVCDVGCIGCRKCVKAYPEKFTASGFKCNINYEAAPVTPEEAAAVGCPRHCLLTVAEHLAIEHTNPNGTAPKQEIQK